MTNAAKRAARTFAQGFVGTLAMLAVPQLRTIIASVEAGEAIGFDAGLWQSVALAAVAGGVIALLAWGQNALEDAGKLKPLMKDEAGTPDPKR